MNYFFCYMFKICFVLYYYKYKVKNKTLEEYLLINENEIINQ